MAEKRMVLEPTNREATAQMWSNPHHNYAMQLLGKRWVGQILSVCMQGPQRFSEFSILIKGLSDRILSTRLRELETEGFIQRIVHSQMPVRVEYQLTEKGYALKSMFEAIRTWAEQWVELPEQCDNDQIAKKEFI